MISEKKTYIENYVLEKSKLLHKTKKLHAQKYNSTKLESAVNLIFFLNSFYKEIYCVFIILVTKIYSFIS